TIVDRTEAIDAAVRASAEGDALLIAGKGHETYQILGTRTIPYDDRKVAREALLARGYRA
ncbi:MAG TPA: UDP-N-acetylmuramoyl-L-alanyl-D-glutamate--2,6-diaminopimelate ligase, partial [Candidatus Eisenbacteria bacterium]|nr:UDP-N-acetylmuramoyl-L-alanyl-D-glutamate--2,6-diaminopimelate ligase [Candidatus Eisenbacteria bacterium]